jgi:N-acetylmuramoyl-L-alanine amidase
VRRTILALAAIALLAATPADTPPSRPVEFRPGLRASIEDGNRLMLLVRAQPGDGYRSLARVYAPDEGAWKAIQEANKSATLLVGRTYRIPYELLSEPYQLQVFLAVFPEDRLQDDAWVHVAGRGALPTYQESLWDVAEWLTGEGRHYTEIQQASGLADVTLAGGEVARIPTSLLKPLFRRWGEAQKAERAGTTPLTYHGDAQGKYAAYRLKKGEALYSSVVMRFTGRVAPAEVNKIARQIARRSGIRNVRRIPVGDTIKIPLPLLLSEHLPLHDPRRIEVVATRRETEAFKNPGGQGDLAGVTIILDAGHGGIDAGAVRGGIYEDEMVYDILCRIKQRLERDTSANVLVTMEDRKTGFKPRDLARLPHDTNEVLLTTPRYHARNRKLRAVAVNLRWYLANSYYRSLRQKGVPAERILFASLHADSLHSSVRGAMVYVPGERYRRGRYGNSGRVYSRHKEVQQEKYVSFTRRQRLRSEGLSRDLARHLVRELRRSRIRIHPHQPIRDHVVRRGRAWVPAVIRSSRVPSKVLIEVANLSNRGDRALLRKPIFREGIAEAFVDAVRAYYR